MWIGGHSGAAVRRAGTIGDGWHPIAMRPPAMLGPTSTARRSRLHDWARRAGRDPKAITLTIRVPMDVRARNAKPATGDRPPFQGTADEIVADIRRYQALGVSHFVFDHTVQELRAVLANMERFASDVRPKLSRAAGGRTAAASSRAGSKTPPKKKAAKRRADLASGRVRAHRRAARRRWTSCWSGPASCATAGAAHRDLLGQGVRAVDDPVP